MISHETSSQPALPTSRAISADTMKMTVPFLRYQVQAERLCRRTVVEFERLKKLRPELPNKPIQWDRPPGCLPVCPGHGLSRAAE